ncbi:SID1 transmembrane family member 2, partial [Manacus vitellinus]
QTEGVRVSVNVLSDHKDLPVLFVVRQKEAVVSFQVPLILRGLYQRKYAYQEVSRTLCQPQTKTEVETQHFYVDVSTLSLNASYQLRVTRVENFVLRTNKRFSFNATASQPQYFKYEFPEGVDSVIVKVTSAMAFPCSVISIQDILCPVYDLDNNVAFIGMYQTMTKKAAITVQKKDFPSHSFYVVVVVKTEDEACGGPLPYYPLSKNASPDEPVDQHNRQKMLEVMVSPAITSEAYVSSVLFCLSIFLSFYVLTLLIACWESCRGATRADRDHPVPQVTPAASPTPSWAVVMTATVTAPSVSALGCPPVLHPPAHGPCPPSALLAGNGSSSSTEGVTDSLASTEVSYSYVGQEQFKRRTPSALTRPLSIPMGRCWYWAGLGQSKQNLPSPKFMPRAQSTPAPLPQSKGSTKGLQGRMLFACAPAVPSVAEPRGTGVGDIHPHWHSHHVPPGQGQRRVRGIRARPCPPLPTPGPPPHPSDCCAPPDTSFMYMIAGLCMLKLYQKRHPDINASAYSAYACLALVIFFSVVGVVFGKGNTAFWIVFSVIHILATSVTTTSCVPTRWGTSGGFRVAGGGWLRVPCARCCADPAACPSLPSAAYGLIVRPNDFASYLLAIGICNLLLYFAFYIIMKLRSGERIKLIPLLCIISTSVVWGFALFFFFQGLSTWQKTPAESREHNRDCILLDFFDDHDIWHFLSSIAMFGSFLVLLTLDDDLDCIQRDKIYVF